MIRVVALCEDNLFVLQWCVIFCTATSFLCGSHGHRDLGPEVTQVLNSVISVLLRQETATWGGCDLGNSGVWERDYGWGVRVRRHLAHAGGVLYGMELGSVTLKNKQPTHTLNYMVFKQSTNPQPLVYPKDTFRHWHHVPFAVESLPKEDGAASGEQPGRCPLTKEEGHQEYDQRE